MAYADNSSEIWKDIPGYEGWYQASSLGRVRSLDRVFPTGGRWGIHNRTYHGRVIQSHPGRQGYLLVCICKNGQHRKTSVHSLVCEAFHGPRPGESYQVAHNDGDKTNNRPSNLRWVTQRENEADKIAHGRVNAGERNGNAKLTEADVRAIRSSKGQSAYAMARRYGVGTSVITGILRGDTWKHVA